MRTCPTCGKVGGDGVVPLLSQHPRLSPSPEGYQWGSQSFPSLAALSSWAASLSWAGPWLVPAPWGQPGNLEQDMPLTLKFSRQAAALVCSPAKQRVLFPLTCPKLFLYPGDAPGPPSPAGPRHPRASPLMPMRTPQMGAASGHGHGAAQSHSRAHAPTQSHQQSGSHP